LLLVAASTFAALLACELLLRVLGYSAPAWYRPDRELGWALRPGVAGWFTREGRAFVEINSAGLRDREHSVSKPADVYRIAVLGDSYSEAMQVGLDQTYWALLPGRLESCGFQPGRRIEVLNFGVSGYGTAQAYLMLQTRALRYRPDLVLLQFTNGNDVSDNAFELTHNKERPFFTLDAKGMLRLDASLVPARAHVATDSRAKELLRAMTDRSRVLQLLRGVRELGLMARAHANRDGLEQGLRTEVLAAPRGALWEEAWRTTEALIGATGALARRNGARPVVFTVPYAIQAHPDGGQRQLLQARLGVADLFYPDRRVASFAESRGILAIALGPEMQALASASGAYFHGFDNTRLGIGHWNEHGHRAAAELIARALCARPTEGP
jgi:lysophospholipase L1-like esterase